VTVEDDALAGRVAAHSHHDVDDLGRARHKFDIDAGDVGLQECCGRICDGAGVAINFSARSTT